MFLQSVTVHPDRFPTDEPYPYNLPVIQAMRTVSFPTAVTCFVGENGTGKSTFLKAIARSCGIHRWGEIDRERCEQNPYEDTLHLALSVVWEDGPVPGSYFDSQTFRHYTRLVDEWAVADPELLSYYGGRSLVSQSHGQSLMAYFANRYIRRGIYFLDEPETALSPKTQIHLRDLIGEMAAGGHAQFILATHSPILLSIPGAALYSFDTCPVTEVACEDTEHFSVYRDFFADEAKRISSGDV